MDGKINKKEYYYGKEDSVSAITVNDDGIVSYTYDNLLRTSSRNLVISEGDKKSYLQSKYTYKDSDKFNGYTTNEIATENIDGLKYEYSYDFIDNIKKLIKNGKEISYEYDNNNQLIRENNEILNQSIIYEYDDGGNITSRKIYTYSTTSLKELLKEDKYVYGNDNWKDQLTSYNNQLISYDAIGNPINYLGAKLTWQGRNLLTFEKEGNKIS